MLRLLPAGSPAKPVGRARAIHRLITTAGVLGQAEEPPTKWPVSSALGASKVSSQQLQPQEKRARTTEQFSRPQLGGPTLRLHSRTTAPEAASEPADDAPPALRRRLRAQLGPCRWLTGCRPQGPTTPPWVQVMAAATLGGQRSSFPTRMPVC